MPRPLPLLTAAALVLAAGGIATASSAATSAAPVVKACANHQNQLSLLVKGRCGRGLHAVTIAATGARGPQGVQGVQGPQGIPGTPADLSAYVTRAEGDLRYAGTTRVVPGATFLPQNSSLGYSSPDFVGIYATDAAGNFIVSVPDLPQNAKVVSVTFYLKCNLGSCNDTVYYDSQSVATAQGAELTGALFPGHQDSKVQTLTLTPPDGGVLIPGAIPSLVWKSSTTGANDELVGAVLTYSL